MIENSAEAVIAVAREQLGANSGRPYIENYNKLTGAALPTDSAWCAAWVTFVMRCAGVPADSVLNFASCSSAVRWFKAQGRFKPRASGYTPQAGDIIMYEWSPQNSGTARDDGEDHTGIVESVDGNTVCTIEGNSGGVCRRCTRRRDDEYISGYCVPLFNTTKKEDDEMLSYEKFIEYMTRYEQERAQRAESEWAKKAVEYCRENGFMVGDEKGNFKPQSPITRQEAAQVVYNLRK